jgi:hypothetical protein
MSDEVIRCRAKIAERCYDGKLSESVYGKVGMRDDTLFDGETVICDVCYIALGQPGVDVRLGPEAARERVDAVLAAYKAASR